MDVGFQSDSSEVVQTLGRWDLNEMPIPQSEPLSRDQVKNAAGGYGWKVDDITRLKRFICLGSEKGTYYVDPSRLKKQNVDCIKRLILAGRGEEVVSLLLTYSVEGRMAKQNSLLLALAICARSREPKTKAAAYEALRDICRIPTFLFQFVGKCEQLSQKEEEASTGWGRAHRKAISKWYNSFADDPAKLAMLVTKYWNRESWNHKDVIRLSHTKPANEVLGFLFRFIAKGLDKAKEMYIKDDMDKDSALVKVCKYLEAVEIAKTTDDEEVLIGLVKEYDLVREHCSTKLLRSKALWTHLLENMPMTAMIRNLGKMSNVGLLEEGSWGERQVVAALDNEEALARARIHPFGVLNALVTYRSGGGLKGHLSWTVNSSIVTALNRAFYAAFKAVVPTGKRYLLALDVSGSMESPCIGSSVTCCEGAAAMLMVCLRTEPLCDVMAFCGIFKPLSISPEDPLEKVIQKTQGLPFGNTDCSLPMTWAQEREKQYDVFVVYTDCDTWIGKIHPAEAMRRYRKVMNLWDARLIVVAMNSSGFTIADPEDRGMMDVVGFDTSAPEAMRAFVMGEI